VDVLFRHRMPTVYFTNADGTIQRVEAHVGETLLSVARRHGIDLEGACDGSLACSTCHVIVSGDWYDKLSEASTEEEDMLDLATGLTPFSRLGCQIIMTEELDGLTVSIPPHTRNIVF
jgi:2Fe-2S ferredoxin